MNRPAWPGLPALFCLIALGMAWGIHIDAERMVHTVRLVIPPSTTTTEKSKMARAKVTHSDDAVQITKDRGPYCRQRSASRGRMSNTASQELHALVAHIREILWPGGNLEENWNSDTLELISFAFECHRPDLIPPDYYDLPPYADEPA